MKEFFSRKYVVTLFSGSVLQFKSKVHPQIFDERLQREALHYSINICYVSKSMITFCCHPLPLLRNTQFMVVRSW